MIRYPTQIDRTARLSNAACLACVLLALLAVIARDVAYRNPSAVAQAPASEIDQETLATP